VAVFAEPDEERRKIARGRPKPEQEAQALDQLKGWLGPHHDE
jgi:hypothetical protein